jgi:hypothetical protein
VLTGQECERSRRQQALHCGHSGKSLQRGRRVATGLRGYGACEAAEGVVQKSGAKDESSRSGTLTFNITHASERGVSARKSRVGSRESKSLSDLVSRRRATRLRFAVGNLFSRILPCGVAFTFRYFSSLDSTGMRTGCPCRCRSGILRSPRARAAECRRRIGRVGGVETLLLARPRRERKRSHSTPPSRDYGGVERRQ